MENDIMSRARGILERDYEQPGNLARHIQDCQGNNPCRGGMTGSNKGGPIPNVEEIMPMPRGRFDDGGDHFRGVCRGTLRGRYLGPPLDPSNLPDFKQYLPRLDSMLDEVHAEMQKLAMAQNGQVEHDQIMKSIAGKGQGPGRKGGPPSGGQPPQPPVLPPATVGTQDALRFAADAAEAAEFKQDRSKIRNLTYLLRKGFDRGENLGIIEELFGNAEGTLNFMEKAMGPNFESWVVKRFNKKLKAVQEDLSALLKQLKKYFDETVREVERLVALKFGPMPTQKRKQMATQALLTVPEFAMYFMILNICTKGLGQMKDGRYESQMRALVIVMEGFLSLFLTGDIEAAYDGSQPVVKTQSMKVGDAWIPVAEVMGIATIPRARIGREAHVLLAVLDEMLNLAFLRPTYGHEWVHDIIHEFPDLLNKIWKAVRLRLQTATRPGRGGKVEVKLTSDVIRFGEGPNDQIDTIDLIGQVIHDTLEETVCDTWGGRQLTGKAFWRNTMGLFCAYNSKGKDPMTERVMLRSYSRYDLEAVEGGARMKMEGHLPDHIRFHYQAANHEVVGYEKEGRRIRCNAEYFAGCPEETVWLPPKEGLPTFRVHNDDLRAFDRMIQEVLLKTKFEEFGNRCIMDLVNYREEDHGVKTDILKDVLIAGGSEVPEVDAHGKPLHFSVSNIAAAPTLAVWECLETCDDPGSLLDKVSENADAMTFVIQERNERRIAEIQASRPKIDAPADSTPADDGPKSPGDGQS